MEERSSIGRAPVSKTGGCEFDSLRSCFVSGCSPVTALRLRRQIQAAESTFLSVEEVWTKTEENVILSDQFWRIGHFKFFQSTTSDQS